MISTPIYSVEPEEWFKSLVLSQQQMGWNGILVQQFQKRSNVYCSRDSCPVKSLAQLTLGQPVRLTQSVDDPFGMTR